jgi:hypothetical protein
MKISSAATRIPLRTFMTVDQATSENTSADPTLYECRFKRTTEDRVRKMLKKEWKRSVRRMCERLFLVGPAPEGQPWWKRFRHGTDMDARRPRYGLGRRLGMPAPRREANSHATHRN